MPHFRPVSSAFVLALVLAAQPLSAAPPPRGQSLDAPPAIAEHKVTRGETLWSISQKHHTSVGAIMDFNHLPDNTVREGMVLKIPPHVVESSPVRHQQVHVVKRGEDFWDIAEHYKIKPSVLAKANPDVNPNRIHADMKLNIPVEDNREKSPRRDEPPARPNPAAMVQHTVGEDETFYSISRRYGVAMEAVVAANPDVVPERLHAGMKVWVPAKNSPPPQQPSPQPVKQPAQPKVAEGTAPTRGRTHTVKENESIALIAKKYAVSESALLRENKLSADDPIYVDDVLKIPGGGAVTSSASSTTKTGATPTKTGTSNSATNSPSTKPPAPAAPPKPPASTAPNTVAGDGTIRSYIVSAGENENTICEAFGISKQVLFDYNRLAATTKLKPGDEIAIPRVAKSRKR
jgi:LysM repeat protein